MHGCPSWLTTVRERMDRFSTLPHGWDNDGAPPIDVVTVKDALAIVAALPVDTPMPSAVTPSKRGGIVFEWHLRGLDIELDIRSREDIELAWEDSLDSSDVYEHLHGDVERLAEPIARLISR